jgi:Predicted transcriptional regulators
MNIVKALADENRVRILMALRGRELCVCQITGLLDLAPSSTSRHLSILRQARLIEGSKRGKWVYYRLPKEAGHDLAGIAAGAVHWLEASLALDAGVEADAKRIAQILAGDECFCNADNLEMCHSPEIHSLEETLLETESGLEDK